MTMISDQILITWANYDILINIIQGMLQQQNIMLYNLNSADGYGFALIPVNQYGAPAEQVQELIDGMLINPLPLPAPRIITSSTDPMNRCAVPQEKVEALLAVMKTASGQFPMPQIITAASDSNGTIMPDGTTIISYNEGVMFEANANKGFEVGNWYVDDEVVQEGGSMFALKDVVTNHNVTVTFIEIGSRPIQEPAPVELAPPLEEVK